MNKVDFFVVGAAKCGTSALFEYLVQHPTVFIPEKKELHFFGSDLHYSVPRITSEEYHSYFPRSEKNKLKGDCSVSYLLSKNAAQEILEYNSEAKIIIIVRDPVQMLVSLHAELVYDGMEKETDLQKALELEPQRRKGNSLPKVYSIPKEFLFYSESVALFTQIQRYYSVIKKENIKLIQQEELRTQPKETLLALCDFLGIKAFEFSEKKSVNPRKKVRFTKLNYLQNQLGERGKSFFRKAIPSKRLRKLIFHKIWALNSTENKTTEIDDDLQKKLSLQLKPEIEGLEQLLKTDSPT